MAIQFKEAGDSENNVTLQGNAIASLDNDNQSTAKKDKLRKFQIQPPMSEANDDDEDGNNTIAQKDIEDRDEQLKFRVQGEMDDDNKSSTLR